MQSARAQVAQLQASLDARQLRAPFAGMMGIPRVELGQYVVPGTIYATLQDLDRMYVDFTVPEQQLSSLELGREVTVKTEVGAFDAAGRIIAIEPQVVDWAPAARDAAASRHRPSGGAWHEF